MKPGSGCPFQAATDYILGVTRNTFQKSLPDGTVPRQFHNKTVACLRGELAIEPAKEDFLRHGLFARAGRYPALIRFSNAFFADDTTPDGRGMAVKLRGVEGEVCEGAPPGQQDFILANQPTAFARDPDEAAVLFGLLDGIKQLTPLAVAAPRFVVPSLNPFRIRWRYAGMLFYTGWRHQIVPSFERHSYFSGSPYQLGQNACKFQCLPDERTRRRKKPVGRDFREKLQSALDQGPVGFDFYLQPRLLERDPVDDPTIRWRSPIFRVGHLEIPPQNVAATIPLGDKIAYSPWNCLRAHTPLGSINELRRHAYRSSAQNRKGDPVFPADMTGAA